MGNQHSMKAGGARHVHNMAHAFSMRVSVPHGKDWKYLQYVRPNGRPVWGEHKCNYVTRLNHFSSGQRLCRELFTSPQFPAGTRVQFYKQFFKPSVSKGDVRMLKMYEKMIQDSTVVKP